MSRIRIEVAGQLEVLSPLHVGTGEGRVVTAVRGAEGTNRPPEVAAIQRDATGKPWIPGSTLKGLLRRLAEALPGTGTEWTTRLLGRADTDAAAGAMAGGLRVRGATLTRVADASGLPYADPGQAGDGAPGAPGLLGRGVYVAARTALDPETGIVAPSRLFFGEMVAAGAAFAFSASLDLRSRPNEAEAARAALVTLLARMAAADGVAIGAGQADGHGRVRLRWESLQLSEAALDPEGRLVPRRIATPALPRATSRGGVRRRWRLDLHCPGPFAVLDASHPARRREDDPQLSAQRQGRLPLLPGPSVMGVLRARAAWIAALDAHRAGHGGRQDDRDAVFRSERTTPLTPVQRLFGVAGYRGLLQIGALEVISAAPWTVSSVKLDRFSGAPIDNALFATACFTDVRVRAVIELADRRGPAEALADAEAMAERLMADVAEDGLRLGHGTNRGFGWFEASMQEEPAHAAA